MKINEYNMQYIRLIKVDRTQLKTIHNKKHIQSVGILIQLSDNKMPVIDL